MHPFFHTLALKLTVVAASVLGALSLLNPVPPVPVVPMPHNPAGIEVAYSASASGRFPIAPSAGAVLGDETSVAVTEADLDQRLHGLRQDVATLVASLAVQLSSGQNFSASGSADLSNFVTYDFLKAQVDSIYRSMSRNSGGGITDFSGLTAADIPALSYLPLAGGALAGDLTLPSLVTSATSTLAGITLNTDCSAYNNGGKLTTDASGNVVCDNDTAGTGGGTPGGSATQIQFNDAGNFDGDAGFTYSKTAGLLTVGFASTTGFSAIDASTTNLVVSGVQNALLKTLNGVVTAAVAGTDYLTAANVPAYPFLSNATSTRLTFSSGLLSLASTTIGNGTAGLTVSGNATTTGLAYFGGRVGIGTTAPATALQIAASGNSQLRLGDSSGAFYFDIGRNGGTGALTIQGNNTSAQNIVLAPTSGNVGIGTTSPFAKFSVAGSSYLSGNVTTGPILTVGTGVNVDYQNAFAYSVSTTQGSNQVTLLSLASCPASPVSQSCAVTLEQAVYTAGSFSQPTYVTAVNGNTITLSTDALSTNASVTMQFGYNRWDTASTLLANTIGVNTGYFGAAALGASNWPNEYLSGSVQPTAASLFVISTSTSLGIFSAARSSDGTSWSPQQLLGVNDAATGKNMWGQYIESHSTNTSTGLTFNGEYSILNHGAIVSSIDPFTHNVNGMTENLRLDCGTGGPNPLNCSDALQILNNGAPYSSAAIVIANNALATSTRANPTALALPAGVNGYAINWFTSAANIGWSLFSNATSSSLRTIQLGSNTMGITGANLAVGTTSASAGLEVFGSGQTTANLTDAGSRNDVLALFSNGGTNGNGGAIAFGNFQAQNAGSIGFAAIKGVLTSGSGNTTGDLAFSTRNLSSDTSLIERMRITAAGNVGIGTTTPGSILSVNGVANFATATSTFYSTGGINLTSGCFAVNGTCLSTSGGALAFSYPFSSNATTTQLTFSSGVLSLASTTIGNGTAGLTVSGNATTTGLAYFGGSIIAPPTANYWLDSGPVNNVGIGGRLFVGPPYRNTGDKNTMGLYLKGIASWIDGEATMGYYDTRSQAEFVSGQGRLAIAAASRSSDNVDNSTTDTAAIGVASFVLNDSTSTPKTAWAFYGHATHLENNRFTTAMELETNSYQPLVNASPYAMGLSGTTAGIWLGVGGEDAAYVADGNTYHGYTSADIQPVSVALGIINSVGSLANNVFAKGIIIQNGALLKDSNGRSVWGQMADGQMLDFKYGGGASSTVGQMFSEAKGGSPNNQTHLVFAKYGFDIRGVNSNDYSQENKLFSIAAPATSGETDYFQLTPGVAGSNAVTLAATGTDANVSLNLLPKGSGSVAIGNGTGGLTVSGNATTTGSSLIGGGLNIGTPGLGPISGGIYLQRTINPFISFVYGGTQAGQFRANATNQLSITDSTGNNPYLSVNTGGTSAGNVGIGSTTPGSLLAIGDTGGINFSLATSTFNTTGGININSGCYAINGTCLSMGGGGGGASLSVANMWTALQTFSGDITADTYNASGASSTILSLNGQPLLSASSTNNSVFLGLGAGTSTQLSGSTGVQNAGVGSQSLQANTTGYNNSAVGAYSLTANTTGFGNSALGTYSLTANTTGIFNVAVGDESLLSNTTGHRNNAIGHQALNANTTGFVNNALGTSALGYNTTGSYNSAVGYNALPLNTIGSYNNVVGSKTLYFNTTGSYNSAFGHSAGYSNTTGTSTTLIGSFSDVGSGSLSTSTAIGAGAIVGASNSLVLGGLGANSVLAGVGTTSPFARFSIQANPTDSVSNTTLFAIGSSTSSATTTLATIDNAGNAYFAGNVGIGTTTPTSLLSISGSAPTLAITDTRDQSPAIGTVLADIQFKSDDQSGGLQGLTRASIGAVSEFTTTGIYTGLAFWTRNNASLNESMRITNSGNVGIGTTTPARALQIASAGVAQMRLGEQSGSYYFDLGRDSADGVFKIQGNGASAQNIALAPTSGNVGIGTATPGANLDIIGSSPTVASYVTNTNAGGQAELQVRNDNTAGSSNALRVGVFGPSKATSGGFVQSGGFVDSGTSLVGGLSIIARASAGMLRFYTGGSADANERLRITSAGNVGIGTMSPSSKLTVWGTDAASSTLAFNIVNSASSTVFAVFNGGNAQLSGTLTQSSDRRLKTNVESLDASTTLAALEQLNPVTFNWIDRDKGNATQIGFIAQDVQKLFPDLVSTTSPTALTPDGTLGVNYIGFIAPIIKSIQALVSRVESLAATVAGFAQSFTSRQVHATDQLCVGDTCVTEAQLKQLLASQGMQGSAPASSSADTQQPAEATSTPESGSASAPASGTASSTPPVEPAAPADDTSEDSTASSTPPVDEPVTPASDSSAGSASTASTTEAQ